MISINQCIMKPYLLAFYYRINFCWEYYKEKAEQHSIDCKLKLYVD